MLSKLAKIVTGILFLTGLILLSNPAPVKADGGILAYYDLWASLKEGHQTAVITIQSKRAAKIDLYVSILDKTKESHNVTFFLPLGTDTTNFYAVEQDIITFDRQNTNGLDSILRGSDNKRKMAMQALFSGALLTNGIVLVPLWTPMLLSGCAAPAPQPEATFQTESSQISIYGIDENTDLQALISTTGLHKSVQDTLSRLRGQQIAVVKLKTQPQTSGTSGRYYQPAEPGLHLSWNTSLVPSESGATYSYPLGTGTSWSKPIELTRVYIVAPVGTDFDVEYPEIGSEQSGFNLLQRARIADYYQVPAYAVDEARGSFGRVWRVTYTQSNPTDDIVITARPQAWLGRMLANIQESALVMAFAFALIVGLTFWILAWYFLMPRFLGKDTKSQPRLQWYYSLIYPGVNAAFIIVPGMFLFFVFLIGQAIAALTILFVVLGGASIGMFELIHAGHLGVSRGKALVAFVLTSLVSSSGYLLLAFIFAKLTSIV